MIVTETFFAVGVAEMQRATDFYTRALAADVVFAMPQWTSLRIAGVRIGLALDANHAPTRTGLHFAVNDLPAALAAITGAGGRVVVEPVEVAPGVVIAEAIDTEGNTLTLRA
jgi:predicted enzyme related to lactoylglutathione lyase